MKHNTIWKFPLKLVDLQRLSMPGGSEPILVSFQGAQLQLWAKVDHGEPREGRLIAIVGTGRPLPEQPHELIGTVQQEGYVWHVFDLGPN